MTFEDIVFRIYVFFTTSSLAGGVFSQTMKYIFIPQNDYFY